MKTFVVSALVAVLVMWIAVEGGAARTGCGVWRQDVKTMTDAGARAVQTTPADATIEALAALPAPPLSAHAARSARERVTYQVHAQLVKVKQEVDSDFHIVLRSAGGTTMIAEIVDPACAAGSPVLAQLRTVRAAFVQRFGQPSTTQFRPVRGQPQAVVAGVLFFDEIHGQAGVAQNGVELHPVLSIR
jgi:hypothetical protein